MPAQPQLRQVASWFDAVAVLGRTVTDVNTRAHNLRVAHLCVQIGRELSMSADDLRLLARAGLMHDDGRIGIPDALVARRRTLSDADWALGGQPELGVSLIDRAARSIGELRAVLYHHERLDGSGYPYGLIGRHIPIEARIVAVADTYAALLSERPYRGGITAARARRVLLREAGSRLDARVVAALFAALKRTRAQAHGKRRRVLAY